MGFISTWLTDVYKHASQSEHPGREGGTKKSRGGSFKTGEKYLLRSEL